MTNRCGSCDAIMHDFTTEEALQCVPPPYILQFRDVRINKEYQQALYAYCLVEEIVGTCLGFNTIFESQYIWRRDDSSDDIESNEDESDGSDESDESDASDESDESE